MEENKVWEFSDVQVKTSLCFKILRIHSKIEEFLATAVKLVKEAGNLITDAMDKQKNVEIDVKEANVAEGNASAVLTETDMKVEQHIIRYP